MLNIPIIEEKIPNMDELKSNSVKLDFQGVEAMVYNQIPGVSVGENGDADCRYTIYTDENKDSYLISSKCEEAPLPD